MTLQKKSIFVTLLIFLVLIAIIVSISNTIVKNGIEMLEQKDMEYKMKVILNDFSNEIMSLSSLVSNYADWDDTCNYVRYGDSNFTQSNFEKKTFINNNLNFITILDANNTILYHCGFDLISKNEMPIPDQFYTQIFQNQTKFLNHRDSKTTVSGILTVDEKPLIISSHPIVSEDAESPVYGTMIMGRFLNNWEIAKLFKSTGLTLNMKTIKYDRISYDFQTSLKVLLNEKNTFIQPIDQQTIAAYSLVYDVFDQPSYLLKIEQTRDIFQLASGIIHFFILVLTGTLFVFLLFLIVFMQKNVLSRLKQICKDIYKVGKTGELSTRIEYSGKDEISQVVKDINKMLEDLEYYHDELEEKEAHLRLITDNMMDMIFSMDMYGAIKYASPSTKHVLGYDCEELTGKHSILQVHPDDKQKLKYKIEKIKLNGSERMELRIKHKNDYYIWIETLGKRVKNDQNEYVGIIFSSRDITERKLVEDKLQVAHDELEKRVEERTDNLIKANIELSSEITIRKLMQDVFQEQAEFEKIIAQISTDFNNSDANIFENTINRALKTLGEFVHADRCYIFQFNNNYESMDNTYEWCKDPSYSQIENLQNIPCKLTPWWMKKLNAFENICFSNIEELPEEASVEKEILENQIIKSLIVVPIAYHKTLLGYLGFDWISEEKSSLNEIVSLLKIVSEIIASASKRTWNETALATQKEQLSVTLKSVSEGVISVDNEGMIIFINKAVEEITGWINKEVEGKKIIDIFEEIDHTANTNYRNAAIKMLNGEIQSGSSKNTIFKAKNGIKKVITYSSSPMIKSQKVIGFVIVLRDITEQRRAEDQLALSRKMESIGVLAAGLAHEINTPMQYIGDNTKFLKDAISDIIDVVKEVNHCIEEVNTNGTVQMENAKRIQEKMEEADLDYLLDEIPLSIEQSLEGIGRVTKLVLTLKDFSHPGIKEKMYSDINRGINGTITISRNEWKYVADIETNLDQNIPLIYCVLDEINQVVLNMIINSAHAIKESIDQDFYSKGKIMISSTYDKDYVKIIIRDNGIGISEANINSIFDPFFTTKEVGKGTGQGLSITHDIIVNKHGGLINVESKEGVGTAFTLCLPITTDS